jgi:hypothetical protein
MTDTTKDKDEGATDTNDEDEDRGIGAMKEGSGKKIDVIKEGEEEGST